MCFSDQISYLCGHVWLVVPGKAPVQHSSIDFAKPMDLLTAAGTQCLRNYAEAARTQR